jgi:hypothetical protein
MSTITSDDHSLFDRNELGSLHLSIFSLIDSSCEEVVYTTLISKDKSTDKHNQKEA